jgi:hypothetical protein
MQSVGRGLTAAITLPILAVGASIRWQVITTNHLIKSMLLLRIICPGKVCKTSLESFGLAEGFCFLDAASLLVIWQLAMGLPDAAAAK